MTVLVVMEVGVGMPVTSSAQLLLVGAEHERIPNERGMVSNHNNICSLRMHESIIKP